MYIGTKEAALRWGISERRIRALCRNGKIDGAVLEGKTWKIPSNAKKPADGRESAKGVLSTIAELKHELDSLHPLTPDEVKALNEQFAVEYTYNSNAIEGNTLTLKETVLVLRGLTIDKKPLKDHFDIIGHKEAFDFVSQLVKDKEPLSEWVIKQIHFLALGRDIQHRGVYRSVPVYISGAKTQTTEPILIPEKIQELLEWYRSDEEDDFLTKIALFHLLFESIHPFIDGNGRTGRLLVNLELMKLGYPPIDIKYTDRKSYYNAFDSYSETGSPKAMFKLFAKYLTERLRRYIETVRTAEQIAKQRER
ncbi:MAG: Fic family protein [Mollicutes bacterium]|nr:Fic family protein [Mollicutes bacterium]